MSLKVFHDIDELLSLKSVYQKQARRIVEKDLGFIKKAAIVTYKDSIIWVGPYRLLSSRKVAPYGSLRKAQTISLKKHIVAPGFVECHTHLLFGGNRFKEFELKNKGISYSEIQKAGGGILSTVRDTRKLSLKKMVELGQKRVESFLRQGVSTVEVKTGYDLTHRGELRMLKAMNLLKKARIFKTFLGCHTIPTEMSGRKYFRFILNDWLPELINKSLADRLDIFVEKGVFTKQQAQKLFLKAQESKMPFTIHADQLSRRGSSVLAAKMGAASVDHVNFVKSKEIDLLSKLETTIVFLPVADFYLNMEYPKARKFLDSGAGVALATDFKPGTAQSQDISFVGLLGRRKMGMRLEEVWAAYTVGAAYALQAEKYLGSIEVGKKADFMVLSKNWDEVFQSVGDIGRAVKGLYIGAKKV